MFLYFYRWKIAIKTTRTTNSGNQYNRNIGGYSHNPYKSDDEISSLMEEAKTMWKVGSYHENIVNLQGITVKVEEGSICQVRFEWLHYADTNQVKMLFQIEQTF